MTLLRPDEVSPRALILYTSFPLELLSNIRSKKDALTISGPTVYEELSLFEVSLGRD